MSNSVGPSAQNGSSSLLPPMQEAHTNPRPKTSPILPTYTIFPPTTIPTLTEKVPGAEYPTMQRQRSQTTVVMTGLTIPPATSPPPLPLPPIPTTQPKIFHHHQNHTPAPAPAPSLPIPHHSSRSAPMQSMRLNTPKTHQKRLRGIRNPTHEVFCQPREPPPTPKSTKTHSKSKSTVTASSATMPENTIVSRSSSTKSAPVGPYVSITSAKGSDLRSSVPAPGKTIMRSKGGVGKNDVGSIGSQGMLLEDWARYGSGGIKRWDVAVAPGCFRFGSPRSIEKPKRKPTTSTSAYGSLTNAAAIGNNSQNVGSIIGEVRKKVKKMLRGFHISVSITFKEKETICPIDPEPPRQTRKEMTIRIKNNKFGSGVFEMWVHSLLLFAPFPRTN
jgi:hypothetical protein